MAGRIKGASSAALVGRYAALVRCTHHATHTPHHATHTSVPRYAHVSTRKGVGRRGGRYQEKRAKRKRLSK
eukprot:603636-Rhodomonas_salina.2